MDTEKKKRGRPRKQKFFENSGIAVRLHSTREHTVQLLISATQTKPQTANMLLATCAYLLHLEHQNSLETSGSQSAQDEAEASAST